MSLNDSIYEDFLNTTYETAYASIDFSTSLLSSNCTTRSIYRVESTLFIVIKGLMMVAIMLTAILGNLLVIVSVLRFERLRLIANTFIVSLAATDLLVACFVMP